VLGTSKQLSSLKNMPGMLEHLPNDHMSALNV